MYLGGGFSSREKGLVHDDMLIPCLLLQQAWTLQLNKCSKHIETNTSQLLGRLSPHAGKSQKRARPFWLKNCLFSNSKGSRSWAPLFWDFPMHENPILRDQIHEEIVSHYSWIAVCKIHDLIILYYTGLRLLVIKAQSVSCDHQFPHRPLSQTAASHPPPLAGVRLMIFFAGAERVSRLQDRVWLVHLLWFVSIHSQTRQERARVTCT